MVLSARDRSDGRFRGLEAPTIQSYLPPVGGLLDTEPRLFDLQKIRWGNCDRSFLAALNAPNFVPGSAVDTDSSGGEYERYLKDDDHVFGFEFSGQAYAVPRWVIFPHELINIELDGVPLSLTFCTLCNAPILYDRRVDNHSLTFGSTGMLLEGNKVMFDEETESLWSQHRGVPIAGEFAESDVQLESLPITQTNWADWKSKHPDTLALDLDTGYNYRFYDSNIGFFQHYWNNENAIQPGVEAEEGPLSEKESVYGVIGEDPNTVHVYPIEAIRERDFIVDELDGREIIVLADDTDDIAVYEAPKTPLKRDNGHIFNAEGRRWSIAHHALISGDNQRDRVPGRHGLWFAFRSQYDDPKVIISEE